MDAALALAGLIAEFGDLLEVRDFEGGEAVLTLALERAPVAYAPFVHFQFARLYREWNKLTSAIDHLNRATEFGAAPGGLDPMMRLQITEELKLLKNRQATQKP